MHHSEDIRPVGTAVVTDEDVATSRGMVAKKAELRDTTHDMSRPEGTAKTRGVAHDTFIFIEAKTQGAPPWGRRRIAWLRRNPHLSNRRLKRRGHEILIVL
jgi:hypothetical protein